MDANIPLPTGTVTFLFTDIEGSTRLWEQHPEPMEAALARHDAMADAAIRQHGGVLVKRRGEGDSLFAVFSRARDAAAAAIALQRAMQTEPWPATTALRVRVAIHTGTCDLRDGDYYGAAVNRCARLRAAAHGGQVLLSGATQELVQDDPPPGSSLRDLGMQRLRDLQRPARVFQLVHPDLPAEFPLRRPAAGSTRRAPTVILFVALALVLIGIVAESLPRLSARDNVARAFTVAREFDNSHGITVGASVRMAGIKIGEVEEVSLNSRMRVRVTMRILAQYRIGPQDRMDFGSEGPSGLPCIDIIPAPDGSTRAPTVRPGASPLPLPKR